jgi:hypothetical protein
MSFHKCIARAPITLLLSTAYDAGHNGSKRLPCCNRLFDLIRPIILTFDIDRAAEQVMV